ncbi:TIGR03620 family F420-dependent LLM class oxidoreductase [Frankia sp. AiPs1]|uniref:TIGR03620 family F420-dependent LLM class oxidoreductase n=1 Tax=Frankia sp. AiPa1 TaxID=573492 RepID=UPI00202B79E3|nr:TIGR03620 family F420-dependent LLM class oxidoreductase [Frankia sp. AiPa1]MCL9762525.1 TIGR03620 family F420-dependent LLM class oxidoreductase [Frankia sp. AiPa1]
MTDDPAAKHDPTARLRSRLGRVGVWTMDFDGHPAAPVRDAVAEIEDLGYGALWFGEGFGRDTVSQAWLLLSATRHLTVAAGIANITHRDPIAMAGATRALGEAFPGRYLLGLGGHRVHDQPLEIDGFQLPATGRAVPTVTAYLDAMDTAPAHSLAPEPAVPRLLAALGPKMLALAARRTAGAHPYFVSVEHTSRARQIMGPDAYLAVEQAVVLDTDPGRGREVATAHVGMYTSLAPHQKANMRRLGFGDDDLPAGPGEAPSRRLIDAIVAYGDLDVLRERVREHLDAGADHVCVQALTADPTRLPTSTWRELAPALLDLT